MATHAASTNAVIAVAPASAVCPISAAAPEYSASTSARVSAAIERKNARTAGRSEWTHRRASEVEEQIRRGRPEIADVIVHTEP